MLRLYDHRTGQAEALPPGRVLRVQVLEGAGYRPLIVTDLLTRVAERAGRHVQVVVSPYYEAGDDWSDYNVQPFEVLDKDSPSPKADLYVAREPAPPVDAPSLRVPRETGDWKQIVAETGADGLSARLAMLEVHYRQPSQASATTCRKSADRLEEWRGKVAQWATSPGRPMNRAYAAKGEAALADDLDAPAALAVLDELAGDPDVPPGAKLETFIHLDLLLGLNLVAAIGR